MLSPKTRRNLIRIIPFGIIWLGCSWVFLINDLTLTRNQNLNPETDITLTGPVILFANIVITLVGLLVGTIETILLEKRFRNYSLGAKVLYKLLLYLAMMLIIIAITYPIAAVLESDLSISNIEIWNKTSRFFQSMTFFNTMIQISFSLLLSLIYAGISENIGQSVLLNLITGKYHKPITEDRIFMFLDMKQSTTIAEKIGHVQYFQLLQAYYEAMSNAIIEHEGEVYQYIGDEVVVTWKSKVGFKSNNCIECFRKLKDNLKNETSAFIKKFGVAPDFKAGIHVGEVTTGEIGALKKEIVFTGDVLNTTARIQGLCNKNKTDLIISEDILEGLENSEVIDTKALGQLELKGKEHLPKLYAVNIEG